MNTQTKELFLDAPIVNLDLKTQLRSIMQSERSQFEAILTPDQLQKLQQLQQARRQQRQQQVAGTVVNRQRVAHRGASSTKLRGN